MRCCPAEGRATASPATTRAAVSVLHKHHWSGAGTAPLGGQYLEGISCASRSYCLAVGNIGLAAAYDGTTWTAIDGPPDSFSHVSCPRAGLCVAVNVTGSSITLRGTTWGPLVTIPQEQANDMMTSISCPTGTFCAAVDKRGRAVTYR